MTITQAHQPPTAPLPTGSPQWQALAARARQLSWLSLLWMVAEGVVAILAGRSADSIALIGFGLDSAIEGFASAIIIWRFTGGRTLSERAERRAQKLVAIQFFILSPYVAVESMRALIGDDRPSTSWVGIALAAVSLVTMPVLGIAKRRIGRRLGSIATVGEGAQNLLCASLAGALLLGLLGNALVGLFIAAVAVREGLEAWRGEDCCAV